jgi:arylsulfatase A-like enzyme
LTPRHAFHPRPAAILAAVVALLAAAAIWTVTESGGSSSGPATAGAGTPGTGTPGAAHGSGATPSATGPQPVATWRTRATVGQQRPNIVFVLTDDLSINLLPYMPQVQALARRGMTFENYFVSDSLCCPSRSSIFTGEFPHDTGVFTNAGSDGGIKAFFAHGDEQRTFNVALQRAGYRTAMMGKYLNGYLQGPARSPIADTAVPPGWNEWDVAGWGYPEYDYTLNENGRLRHFGHRPRDYLTNVLTRRASAFVNSAARGAQPFFLELATFTPHSPYVPAPRDAHRFPHLKAPISPQFDTLPLNAPAWLAPHPPLTRAKIARIDRVFRRRAQDVQSVGRMLERVEHVLARHHLLRDTYVIFSSDNGYHTGEYRLMPGKLTAFDTDIHVPLVVAGPGVPHGSVNNAMTENIDLAETFAQIAGTSLAGDGHSLSALLHGRSVAGWRDAVLVEHHGNDTDSSVDPDSQSLISGNPPSYEAIRTPGFLYVEYVDGEREFYDLRNDPFELDNLVAALSPDELADLHADLAALEQCHGASTCWSAAHVRGPVALAQLRSATHLGPAPAGRARTRKRHS